MPVPSQSEVSVHQTNVPATAGVYTALYDGQCEICQAFVSWLRVLDKRHRVTSTPISAEALQQLGKELDLTACLRQLHVIRPEGRIEVGWDAVACLARLFPATWVIGTLGRIPPFRQLGRLAYGFVAANRYSLSKCRGGACSVARPALVRRRATLGAFWSCYTLGLLLRLPLVIWTALADAWGRVRIFFSTWGRRLDLLHGKLTILFLSGPCPNLVPLIFGELFTALLYDGVAIDPGSPKMRASLRRHLRGIRPGTIRAVVGTHHHEEHIGNLDWLAGQAGVKAHVPEKTARLLQPPSRLPFARRLIIGQPPALNATAEFLESYIPTAHGRLQVINTPGHCDDHVSLYDPEEKVLLAGDAFMGAYFATPNPDVDSRIWVETLERLLELDIEILVEGHGHIHTLRPDIPFIRGVVTREDPRAAIEEKLRYLRWVREQVESGFREGMPVGAIEATCFPWGKRRAWETFANDELIRALTLGHFSRTELVRSFVRSRESVLPVVYEVRFHERPPTDGRDG
ncbi:MAG TPA: MBL fold metallo-hydrolase [Terriglobales bacterium]|jgi:glyoxylase-like metal-dependent hydrolase (beta-lactamase superfamily II)/predicted DCC family thiol-disulfide oxidoreductase YuxK|nr:MBL fold metallo-hydrolase [Terriglobales bacterium]